MPPPGITPLVEAIYAGTDIAEALNDETKDEADAVRIANDSVYGLGGSIWSSDEGRARKLARQVQTGTIGINGYMPSIGSPFGGVKASGLGREFGPEALGGYQQYKSTYVMG